MKKIAFITARTMPEIAPDDALTLPALAARGIAAHAYPWDSAQENPKEFEALVFRTCWNYTQNLPAFLAWLTRMEASGARFFPSIQTARWNLDKKYLLELGARGVPLPRTLCVPAGTTELPPDWRQGKIVVKPAVSASGLDTFLVDAGNTPRVREILAGMPAGRAVLAQEFLPEIQAGGEISLVYFGGKFSHALQKKAADGEFRIQQEYGGTRLPYRPSERLLAQAEAILRAAPEPLLFARVDVVLRGEEALLMELEILDPFLSLDLDPRAPENFATAIAAALP